MRGAQFPIAVSKRRTKELIRRKVVKRKFCRNNLQLSNGKQKSGKAGTEV